MNISAESSPSTLTKTKQFYLVIAYTKLPDTTLKWWVIFPTKKQAEEYRQEYMSTKEGQDRKAYIIPLDRQLE